MCYAYLVSTENVHVAEPVLFQDEGETCDWHLLPKNSTYAQRVSVHTANRDQMCTVFRGVRPLRVDSQLLVSRKCWVLEQPVDPISAV